jgi:hypothetical protein
MSFPIPIGVTEARIIVLCPAAAALEHYQYSHAGEHHGPGARLRHGDQLFSGVKKARVWDVVPYDLPESR